MAINPFIGVTQAQLERWLADAQADLAAGKTLSSYGSGDVSGSKLIQMTPLQRIEKLLYALYLLDPTTYPLASIKRVTRTRVEIYSSDA